MYALGSQRSLFDIPEGVAFFNTATNSPLLNTSRARLLAAAGQDPSAVEIRWHVPFRICVSRVR